MKKSGSFSLVLHSHLPYVRQAGAWPHGEEMIHEAICDTYVPLLNALYDLAEEDCPFRIAIGITPVLAEQLADPTVLANFRDYMLAMLERTDRAARVYGSCGNDQLYALAKYYIGWASGIIDSFNGRFGGDLIAAFRKLQDGGLVEIVAGAATHGFLPLMSRDSTISAQLSIGADAYVRRFGRKPVSFWLPECGYRPAYYDVGGGKATFRPGLEGYLERLGIRCFFADSAAVEGGGASEADAASELSSTFGSAFFNSRAPRSGRAIPLKSTAWPYLVSDSAVSVFGRDRVTGRQVWSASEGYPGGIHYREFHKKDPLCGMRFWRISGSGVPLEEKDYYDPEQALSAVARHVDHFVALLEAHVEENASKARVPPAIVSPYDTELFGHWWFEGVEWLKQVLRRLARDEHVELTTPATYIERYPPSEKIALPESSWGAGGDARTWMNDQTRWMWPIIHDYERQMEQLVQRFPSAEGPTAEALAQASRELLLLQSSDWPFLVSTGQASQYASQRFRSHAARFDRLVDLLLSGADPTWTLPDFEWLDNPFPRIDYHAFSNLQSEEDEATGRR